MMHFKEKFEAHLEARGWSPYRAAMEAKIDSGVLYRVMSGKRNLTVDMINKLISVKGLGLTKTMLRAWKARDEYSVEELKLAIQDLV